MTYTNVSAGDPILASTINDLIRYGPAKPICMLQQGTTTQTISAITETLLTYGAGSEIYDDLNWHDITTNNSRITPTVAGRYKVTLRGVLSASFIVYAGHLSVYKNGAQADQGGNVHYFTASGISTAYPGMINTATVLPEFVTYVDANGTTDYFESYIYLNTIGGATQNTANTASGRTTFMLELERAP